MKVIDIFRTRNI